MKSFAILFSLAMFARGQDLPTGKDKELAERICATCHGTDLLAGHRDTKEGWTGMVEDMYNRGASSSDAEKERLITYLSTYLGKMKNDTPPK